MTFEPRTPGASDAVDQHQGSSVFGLLWETLHRLPGGVVAATVAVNITSLALPLVTIQVYDRIVPQRAVETLAVLAMAVAAIAVFEALLKIARSQVVFWAATQSAWSEYSDALSRVLAAPRDWVIQHGSSRILDRMRAQATVSEWHGSPSRLVLIDLPFVLVFVGLMALVGGWMALVPVVLFSVLGYIMMSHSQSLQNAARARAEEDMRSQDFLVESIGGLSRLKSAAMEAQMCRRYERLQGSAAYWSYEATRIAEDARGNADLLASLTQIVTLGVGAIAVINDSMTAGTLAGCTMLAGRSVQPVLRFMAMWNEIQSLSIESDKAQPIWRLPAARLFSQTIASHGAIGFELEGVSVMPQGGIRPGLSNATLTVEPGSVVAVLGTFGPGSSPLSALITGRLAPNTGSVRVDGHDPATESDTLRGKVLAVLPTYKPIGGTLLENLAMFRDGDAVADARDAARLIGLENDILHLPQGYDTRIGDTMSSDLSEGLLQMVAIARAIALKPGLLILDEANTALDNRYSSMLERALPEIAKRMTILLLTNRPSLAACADRRFAIEDGQFVDLIEVSSSAAPPVSIAGGS